MRPGEFVRITEVFHVPEDRQEAFFAALLLCTSRLGVAVLGGTTEKASP